MSGTDVREFLAAAGEFLEAEPIAHSVVLTEAAYLEATGAGGEFGWWSDEAGVVGGAFLCAPNHSPVLTPVPEEALPSLVALLGDVDSLGVDGRDVERVAAAWRDHRGVALEERSRVALCRLTTAPMELTMLRRSKPGGPRRATWADRELLVGWFHALMAANPGDPSDLAYVIDEPLRYGGLTLWEVDGQPVAMAGRSRVVAGMTRVSAAYALDYQIGTVFAAACLDAVMVADHVLVLTTDVSLHERLGFSRRLDRVTLEAIK